MGKSKRFKVGYSYEYLTLDGTDSIDVVDDLEYLTLDSVRMAIVGYYVFLIKEHDGMQTWLKDLYIIHPNGQYEYYYKNGEFPLTAKELGICLN